MKRFTLKPILFMMIITMLYTGVLATMNEVTKSKIYLNQQLKQRISYLYALGIDIPNRDGESVDRLYQQHIKEVKLDKATIYKGYKDDEIIGYILPIQGDAVWGALSAVLAITPDFKTILGIDFLSHNETPGLGGRIDEKPFKEQFRNIILDLDQDEDFILFRPHPQGQVDAISGATGTSNAVRRILNNNLKFYITEIRGEL